MFLAFMFLLMICGALGVLIWLAVRRVIRHMQDCPEAARLISEHVITPLLTGKPEEKREIEKPE
jgi:hypothetical protein